MRSALSTILHIYVFYKAAIYYSKYLNTTNLSYFIRFNDWFVSLKMAVDR